MSINIGRLLKFDSVFKRNMNKSKELSGLGYMLTPPH